MQKLDDVDFADDVSLLVLSNMVGHMQANMRLSNIARTAGLESDQHHCKNLASLWAFMSQECFFFVLH